MQCSKFVHYREYAVVVGDHPSCKDGLPISLDWKFNAETTTFDVSDFETIKPREKPKPLNYFQRKLRLEKVSGLPESELRAIQATKMLEKQGSWFEDCYERSRRQHPKLPLDYPLITYLENFPAVSYT